MKHILDYTFVEVRLSPDVWRRLRQETGNSTRDVPALIEQLIQEALAERDRGDN